MKYILLLLFWISATAGKAQDKNFPAGWSGTWKGTLSWYRNGNPEPQQVSMELTIDRDDSSGHWTWQLVYGSKEDDYRPYILLPKDSAGIHWAIDELNGIVLDQYWLDNKFCGAFQVGNVTIVNNYHREGKNLVVEFYTLSAEPVATTGKGTADSPLVDSYRMNGYQKAVLKRSQ